MYLSVAEGWQDDAEQKLCLQLTPPSLGTGFHIVPEGTEQTFKGGKQPRV